MDNTTERYKALVRKLYEKTISGEISWDISYSNEICYSMKDYTIHLKDSRDADGEPLEIVELRNDTDQVIDSFSDTDLAGFVDQYFEISNYYQLMSSLRHSARRNALGADKALDEIMRDLGGHS